VKTLLGENKKVLVTGGTRGIGLAIAEYMLDQGYKITVTGTSPFDPINHDSRFNYINVDFSCPNEIEKFIENIIGHDYDVVINNAGINKISPFEEIDEVDFDRIIAVNLKAPFRIIKAVLPSMKKNNFGRIVNISSIFGIISKEYRAPYSASKFALHGMSLALSAEVAKNNILVNTVSPGFIDTELTRKVLGETGINKMLEIVPIRRLGKVTEIAKLVGWLSSENNTFVTGQNIAIDGGFVNV